MGVKSLIPGTAEHSKKHHVKYLRRKLRGYDVMLLVEWEDGALTEVPANIRPEWDGWYEAANGLVFAVQGEGIDPVDWYGVPTVRCHAAIGCPFSTEACLAAEADEAGEFQYRDTNGQTTQVVHVEEIEQPDAPASTNGHSDSSAAATDGGVEAVDVETHERVYDLRPPAGSAGWAFGMSELKQRAPNPISSNDLRRAVEYGKESERDTSEFLKMIGIGFGLALLAILVVFGFDWLLAQIGGGGGGGGGGVVFGSLLAVSGQSAVSRVRQWISDHGDVIESAARRATVFFGILAAGFLLITASAFWSDWMARHPEMADQQFRASLTLALDVAFAGPAAAAIYYIIRSLRGD